MSVPFFGYLPLDEYLAMSAVSSSDLKALARSPAHYRMRTEKEQTSAMLLGSLTHCMILEPDEVNSRYWACELDRRTKAYKEAMADQPAGTVSVTLKEWEEARRMADTVHGNATCVSLLSSGLAEQSVFATVWDDPDCSFVGKCRPDYLAEFGDSRIHVSLKTTRDASPDAFSKRPWGQYWKLGYHMADAWYARVLACAGQPVEATVTIAIEAPGIVQLYELSDSAMAEASEKVDELLALLSRCQASGEWPGYSTEIQTIE